MNTRKHGTRTRYVNGPDINDQPGPCHCPKCRAANNAAQRRYQRRKAQEAWAAVAPTLVDAAPVRAHVKMLGARDIGWKRVAALSGVAQGAVSRLLYGANGNPPSARVRPETARRIFAVQPSLDVVGDKTPVDGAGTRRRLQALCALGWSISAQARRIGWEPTNLWVLAQGRPQVVARTARLVREAYNELSMTPAPPGASSTRARRMATAKGWLPPLAWDDDLIDLPDVDLDAEIARRVAAMDDTEVRRCHNARYRDGDLSPLIVAGAQECGRRRRELKVSAG